jgi:pimeloyl-ACP methyl ester carboxylesterase
MVVPMSDTKGPAADVAVQTIDVAGTPTALRRAGEGPPLLFLHGAGFTGSWLRFHEALAKGADLLAPEHIGFGDTPMQEWMRGMDDMLVHYDDLVRTLDLERFDLVGYSLGGWIAARYAVLWPERVRSLTLIVPAGLRLPGTPTPPDVFLMDPDQLADHLFEDRTNIDEVFALPEGVDPIDAAMRMYAQMSAAARLLWNPRHDRSLPRVLRRITAPTLLVGAENDRLLPDENTVGSYGQLIPHARTERIPGTGHALVIEQPDAVAQTVLNFVKEAS